MDRRIIDLYYEYTHRPLARRVFLRRLAGIAGGSSKLVQTCSRGSLLLPGSRGR